MNIERNNLFVSPKQKHEAHISKNYRWKKRNNKFILIDKRKSKECNPNDIDVKISIYEDRVKGWFLDHADFLKSYGHTGFVILQIAVSYIEANQQVKDGKSSKNRSSEFFIKGMRRIFGKEHISKRVLSHFYDQVRCGLFHDGMTKGKVFISCDFLRAVSVRNDIIYIHPHYFLDKIKEDFSKYISELRDIRNKDLRANFERMFYFGKGAPHRG